MLNSLKKTQNKDQGFTIIEVMIVLAIAGLIMLIVFLAVPALQRNSRNTQRKNDASKVASLITEYESNNNGAPPTGVKFVAGGAGGTAPVDATAEKFSILDTTTMTSTPVTGASATITLPVADQVLVYSKAKCVGTGYGVGTSARQLVVVYYLEGATASGCIDL